MCKANWHFLVRSLFTLIATTICLLQVTMLLYSFAVSDKWAVMTVNKDEVAMVLPDLVLCNSNQINRTLASEIGINDEYLTNLIRNTSLEVEWNSYFKSFSGALTITDMMYNALITGIQYSPSGVLSLKDIAGSLGIDHFQLRMFTASLFELYHHRNRISYQDLMFALAHSCNRSILQCQVSNKRIDCCHGSTKVVTRNGVCIKLARVDDKQLEAGPGEGYRIMYELHTNEFISGIMDNDPVAGIYLRLGYGENISTEIAVQPSVKAMIALTKVEDKYTEPGRMDPSFFPPPCRVNTNNGKLVYKNVQSCKDRSIEALAIALCGCEPIKSSNKSAHCDGHHWLRCIIKYEMWKDGKAEPADFGLTIAQFKLKYSTWTNHWNLCTKPCEQTWVVASVTTTQFGADEHVIKMSKIMRKFYGRTDTPEYIKRNFILLDIYFAQFSIRQNVMYTVATLNQLMSLIGGQLGLWVGASVVSLVNVLLQFLPAMTGQNRKKNKTGTTIKSKQRSIV